MSQITVQSLTFCYDGSYDNVFEDVTFTIDTNWKLGFIGRNGRGKTTFLNLLMGKYEYRGNISASVQFDCFPFEVPDMARLTCEVIASVCPTFEAWELSRELSLLEVGEEVLNRPFETLSNGERTKVLLCALFLRHNNFLLIDEPTNHLDMRARETVSEYLKSKRGFILVSHDRVFLDNCIDHVLSINKANIEVQSGNFSSWQYNKQSQDNFEMWQNEKLQKDISRLGASARRTAGWSEKVEKSKHQPLSSGLSADKGYIGHKAAKMMKRAKAIEGRRQNALEEKSKLLKNIERADSLSLKILDYHTSRLAELEGVSIFYDDKAAVQNVTFTIDVGDRIALQGRNGCGKTSLIKLIMGGDLEYTGRLSVGNRLVISYVSQDTSFLRGELKDYAVQEGIDLSLFLTILRKLDFSRTQFEKDMSDFSEGQKKKVLLAGSLCQPAHLYIWDEPLNFIDVLSRIQVEDLISQYRPTMLFVEHDSAFCANIATKTVQLG